MDPKTKNPAARHTTRGARAPVFLAKRDTRGGAAKSRGTTLNAQAGLLTHGVACGPAAPSHRAGLAPTAAVAPLGNQCRAGSQDPPFTVAGPWPILTAFPSRFSVYAVQFSLSNNGQRLCTSGSVDAALLNVVRACETAIDLANHIIRVHKLGIPVSSADTFELLKAERIIHSRLAERMKRMVGFRNTVVHQYTKVDLSIVAAVIVTELDELLAFADKIRKYVNGSPS